MGTSSRWIHSGAIADDCERRLCFLFPTDPALILIFGFLYIYIMRISGPLNSIVIIIYRYSIFFLFSFFFFPRIKISRSLLWVGFTTDYTCLILTKSARSKLRATYMWSQHRRRSRAESISMIHLSRPSYGPSAHFRFVHCNDNF